jgi:copper homeostasis protein
VHVLIRARSGHFCYSDFEMDVMLEDIEFCKKVGVKGIVAGVLLDDFTIDVQRTSLLIENSRPMKFTFHRAFDWVPNPEEALALLETLHVDYILSSGKQESAVQGLELLKKLQARTQTTQIMAGAGINLRNVIEFKKQGLKAVHLSGTLFEKNIELPEKILLNSSQHLSEHKVAVTKEHIIRQIIKIVK